MAEGSEVGRDLVVITLYIIIGANKHKETTNIEEKNGITQCKKSFGNPELIIVHYRFE